MDKLPDEIIQHIQSFLQTKEEEARTILVSKSWLRAWSTRHYLNFDSLRLSRQNYNAIVKLIGGTLDSYVEQGLTIVKLRLRVDTIQERWLQLARQCNVITLDLFSYRKWKPTFWREIFMTNSLQSLAVDSPQRKLVLSHTDIKCCNLNTLDFIGVDIDYITFFAIMSVCPLIEKLQLFECVLVNSLNSWGFVGGEYASLKTLSLIKTVINDEQLHTVLSKSPQLEDLNLIDCCNLVKPINLSSVSLKRVKIVVPSLQIIRIDAPNLRQLKYLLHCHRATPFPVTSSAMKGEINLDIVYHDQDIDASWFHGLREFVSKFAKSNVKISPPMTCNSEVIRATPLPHLHQFESLTIRDRFPRPPFFYALFTICHPKNVLLEGPDTLSNLASLKKLRDGLLYRRNLGCCKLDQNKCWRHYIKDVKLYHVVDNEHKPLRMIELRMACMERMVISLALEWMDCSD